MAADYHETFSNLRDELDAALREMERRDIRWQNTRFDHYLRVLAEEARLKEGRIVVVAKRQKDFISRLWEVIGQSRQLIHTRKIWNVLDAELLRTKLGLVVKGRPIQPQGSENDSARDALLELVTAWLLHETGFQIDITGQEADVIARLTGFPPFAVECKRPANQKSLWRNFKLLRHQLTVRYGRDGYKHGMPVVAIDRVVRLAMELPVRLSVEHVKRDIYATLSQTTDSLRAMAARVGYSPETTPIGAVLLVGAVFVFEPFGVSTMEYLGFFNIAPIADTRVVAIAKLKGGS